LGRNGYTLTTGLDVSIHKHSGNGFSVIEAVEVSPINSRGYTSRCRIVFPKDKIPEVIKALQSL